MSQELKKLLQYLKKINHPKFSKISKLSKNFYKKANDTVLHQKISVDIWEMESLVNPDKFEFPDRDVGLITVKK